MVDPRDDDTITAPPTMLSSEDRRIADDITYAHIGGSEHFERLGVALAPLVGAGATADRTTVTLAFLHRCGMRFAGAHGFTSRSSSETRSSSALIRRVVRNPRHTIGHCHRIARSKRHQREIAAVVGSLTGGSFRTTSMIGC